MDWDAIGLAGASALLAGLIIMLIGGWKNDANNNTRIIWFAVVFLPIFTLSQAYILPERHALKAQSVFQEQTTNIPAFQSLMAYEPKTYNDIAALVTEAARKGHGEQQTLAFVHARIDSIYMKRLPKASDQAIVSYLEVAIDEIQELQKHGGDHCYTHLIAPEGAGVNPDKLFSKELRTRNVEVLDLVIKSYDENQRIPSKQEVMPFVDAISAELFELYGDDVTSALESPAAFGGDKDKVCHIWKTLFSKILELDREQAVEITRWMFKEQTT